MVVSHWIHYAQWEGQQQDIQRARSTWERALDNEHRKVKLWLRSEIIQCNVTQTPPKARTQLDALAPKQQQQQKQQLAVATAQFQQEQQLTSAALQCLGAPILPHNGTQGKMRTKQQPGRPALSALKTENGQLAGQNKVVGHMATVQQQQQATANLQQVVNLAGNKMVVMNMTGTPLQNGQTLHASTAGVDKQQQQ
ncbi:hypothetical protein KR200_001075 [Drosophila serrata]|nr:hypothetical protein KR200_001075 [Drosophila serrata]